MLRTDVAHLLAKKYGKQNPPLVKAGDTVRVHQKIKEGEKERIQIFEGLVIAVKHGRSLDATFTVRKIAAGGVGVERTYPLHSPNVVKVERTKTASVSRGKLYYMRERMGKTARFKNESPNPLTWTEPNGVVEETPVDMEEDTAAEITEAVVETANEQEEAVVETPAEEPTEAPAEETEEK
jgi:large subunit ribosomal protein L19